MGSTFIYIRLMPTVWLRYFCMYIVCHLLFCFRSMVPLQLHQWRLRDALLKWNNWVWMMYVVLLWWLLKDNEMQCCRIHVANIVTLIIYLWHAGLCCVSWILSRHLYHEIQLPNLLVRGWEISTSLEIILFTLQLSFKRGDSYVKRRNTKKTNWDAKQKKVEKLCWKITYCPCTAGGTQPSPDIRQNMQQISPEKFHNLLSLASSPPLSSHVAGVNTALNPTALEFIPGKESHDTPPAAATIEKTSTPSFAQVCMLKFRYRNSSRFLSGT